MTRIPFYMMHTNLIIHKIQFVSFQTSIKFSVPKATDYIRRIKHIIETIQSIPQNGTTMKLGKYVMTAASVKVERIRTPG